MIGFLSGVHVVDFVLVIVAVEAAALMVYWFKTGGGVAPRQLLPNLLAGVALLLALRFAISGLSWPYYTICLALAGVANVVDIRQRWRQAPITSRREKTS